MSAFGSSLSGRRSRYEKAHSGGRGPTGYSRIIRDMLASTDYEIVEAEDGEQALAAIAKQRPDLILMDVQLPNNGRLHRHAPDQG
jgi:Response regulator receiver domain